MTHEKDGEFAQWPLLQSWQVPSDHPVLAGHFPGYPVIPGALLLDWVVRSAEPFGVQGTAQLRATRFHAPARAGMGLRLHGRAQDGAFQFAVLADDGHCLCTGSLGGAPGASS